MFEERKGEKQVGMGTLVLGRMWPQCGNLVSMYWANEVGYPELHVDWIALV